MTDTQTNTTAARPHRPHAAFWAIIVVLLVVIGGLLWYGGVFRPRPKVALVTSSVNPYWDRVIDGAKAAAKMYDVELSVHKPATDPYHAEVDVYLVGRTSSSDWVGLHSISVET